MWIELFRILILASMLTLVWVVIVIAVCSVLYKNKDDRDMD